MLFSWPQKNVYDLLESWKFEHEESPLISDALLEEVATYGDSQVIVINFFLNYTYEIFKNYENI